MSTKFLNTLYIISFEQIKLTNTQNNVCLVSYEQSVSCEQLSTMGALPIIGPRLLCSLSALHSASELLRRNAVPETKTAEFANSIDLDEVDHSEPPHLDLYCLPSSLCILNII